MKNDVKRQESKQASQDNLLHARAQHLQKIINGARRSNKLPTPVQELYTGLSVGDIKQAVAAKLSMPLSRRIEFTHNIAQLCGNVLSPFYDPGLALRAADMLHKIYGDYAPIDIRAAVLVGQVDAAKLSKEYEQDH